MNEPIHFEIKLNGDRNIAIPASGIVYTDAFKFGDVNEFALVYKVTATGIPNVKIQMEQSISPPAIENAADANFFVPKTVGDIETSLTSISTQGGQLMPITVAYIRFKITELTGGVSDTTLNMWISLQKKFSM